MGAVIILGLTATVLVRAASEALGAAGNARRTLGANLIADQALVEIEATAAANVPPEIGERAYDVGELHVELSVAPAEAATLGLDALLPPQGAAGTQPPELFAASGDGFPLLRADVRVSWSEGFGEREVTRSTFLFVPSESQALQALAPAPDSGGDAGVPPPPALGPEAQ